MSFAGRLDRRVKVQKRTLSKDETGSQVETWEDAGAIWAQVVAVRGAERIISQSETVINNIQFRIRFKLIEPENYRLIYQGKTYQVVAATEFGSRQSLTTLDVVSA